MPIQQPLTKRRPRALAALAIAGAFLTGGLVLPPLAATAQESAMHAGMGMGDHAKMHEMMAAHLDKMLSEVDATPEQKSKIHAILGQAMASMGGAHERMHARMTEFHAILTAPTIDRGALERLRATTMADLDTHSRTLVTALADAAEVLRPEQRAKLATMMRDRTSH